MCYPIPMEIRKISFYDMFTCLAGACPHTCCHGWMIPLTPEDRTRFKEQKGLFKLSLLTRISSEDFYCFNKGSMTCPFVNDEGLCSLQLKMGHDFIPEACRMFPRFYRNYGPFEERYLDLSCIAAASIFLEGYDGMSLVISDEEPASEPCTTNDDSAFLDELLSLRDVILKRLEGITDAGSLNRALKDIRGYSSMMQRSYLEGLSGFAESHPFDDSSFTDENDLFPLSIDIINSVMNSSFYHSRLKHTNPMLYKLCRLYFDDSSGITDSDEKWKAAVGDFVSRNKEAVPISTAYYAYYLYLYFLKSYEDYSFVRNASMGIIHINLILLFSVLLEQSEPGSYSKNLAALIASYDRRACFNDEIMDEMYHCLDPLEPSSFS